MAHRHQRGPVRGRGDGGRRRPGAVSRAALVALALIPAAAAAGEWTPRAEPAGTTLPDPQSWYGEYGRPGWVADLWLDGESPAQLAGHARGGIRLDEPGRPARILVDPARVGAFTPLTFYDSLRVTSGTGAARQGFDGALTTIEGRTGGPGPRGAEAIIDIRSGDFAWDENSLMIGRRDSLTWLRAEAYGLERDAAGYLMRSGRHMWDLAGGVQRGRHFLSANFGQQGVAGRLLGSEEQSNTLRIGGGTYRYVAPSAGFELDVNRGRSRNESFSDYFDLSVRDASVVAVSGRAWHRSGVSAGLDWRKDDVVRSETDEFDAHARSMWGVLGWTGAAGTGTLTAEVGAGRHQALGRNEAAPSLSYEVRGNGFTARAGVERVLHAMWTDLAFGQEPFLQRTWAGVFDLSLGTTPRRGARVTFLGGRTESRAIISRTPLTEYALRFGAFEDAEPYSFGLLSVEGRTQWWRLFATGSAFALGRATSQAQPRVDPGFGGRAVAGTRFHLFQGDVQFELYGGVEGVGARESEIAAQRVLPGYATSSAGIVITFGDVWMSVRARNLENEIHEEPWEDSATGLEALGPGREFRFALTAVLHN